MQRVLPENDAERTMLSMAAVFIEENHILDDLYEVIGSDLLDGESQAEALAGDTLEHIKTEVAEYFFRLDMNWGAEIRDDCLQILQEFWGVHDRESALKTIQEIRRQGHRAKFKLLKSSLPEKGQIDSKALEKFKQIFTFDFQDPEALQFNDEDYRQLATWIQKTDRFVGECGILGWDAARLVHLARLSFVCGFLSDTEAWSEIQEMEKISANKFKDWREFALSFIIGRTFWAGEEDPAIKKICERLLGHPASPWHFFSCKV